MCLGNICRSPLAQAVFDELVVERGLGHVISSDSCGTGAWHVGNDPDPRSIAVAQRHGIPISHKARQFSGDDLQNFQYVLPMDRNNFDDIMYKAVVRPKGLFKMRDFDTKDKGADVPDPYYGGDDGFENVYKMLKRSCENLLDHIVMNENLKISE